MFEIKVDPAIANTEVSEWLDHLRITPGLRQTHKDMIDTLVEAVSLGMVEINEDQTLTQNLQFPVGEITQLKYKNRLNDFMLEPYLKGVKASDGDGRILAYKAALTSTLKSVLQKLDSSDQRVANSIVVFFIG